MLTRDFGQTYEITIVSSSAFTYSEAKDSNGIWIAGFGGKLFKYNFTFIGIEKYSEEIPNEFILQQNFPNPFNPDTRIRFEIPKLTTVELIVYDVSGREVYRLAEQYKQPGKYEISFDATSFASGVYFYRLIAGDIAKTMKMVLLK